MNTGPSSAPSHAPFSCAQHGSSRKTASAFTLMELMVVISIIALLASITLSGLTKAKIQAREVVCRSNLSQFAIIWKTYTEIDYGRYMQRGCGFSQGAVSWFQCIREYYDPNSGFLFCPMATRTPDEGGENPYMAWENTTNAGFYYKGSYGINLWVANGSTGCQSAGPNFNEYCWRTSSLPGVSYAPLQLCSQWKDVQPYPTDDPPAHEWDMWTPNAHEMRRACIKRHDPYHVQVLFLDFSVDERTIKELWRLKWHKQWPPDAPLPDWDVEAPWMSDVPDPD
ncbi:MAG: type II secretion system protein [Planctomycetota bacterium]